MSDKTKDLEKTLQQLSNDIVTDTDKLDLFCKQWNNGFHNYSFSNTILIWWQKNDATLCAGYHTWLDKKRFVKRGEKAISILAPMFFKNKKTVTDDNGDELEKEYNIMRFRIVSVFDVSQTDGEALEIGHSDKVRGNTDLTLDKLASIFTEYPIIKSNGLANGHTDGKAITISERDNSLSEIATYFHELAHCMLNHQENMGEYANNELEAEAVSYIVCASVGLDNQKSKYYIGNWHGDKTKLGNSGHRIIKTAEKIVRAIEATLVTPSVT